MKQTIIGEHKTDEKGNPTGGRSFGTGIEINWQNGPLGRGRERVEPTGAFVEGVIEAARQRIAFYQTASAGKFACNENAQALHHLTQALEALERRTQAREVEGLHVP